MGNIVSELTKLRILRADVWIKRGPSRVSLSIEPETVEGCSRSMISSENVVWICNPETGWSLVCVQKRPRLLSQDSQIFLEIVFGFDCILDEEGVTHRFVSNIISNSQIMNGVNSDSSVVSMMNCITVHITIMDCTYSMEVNRVSTKLEGLTNVSQFNILDPSN